MQTMAVQIQDGYVKNFMSYVNSHSENITIAKDKNLEYDPYFYERQQQLQQDIEDIDNGKAEMLSSEQFDLEMDIFFKDLKSNANI
ncbi:MAG: hypothetical protein U9O56_01735 [Campylobacterota bacterium]|nr:hypothetical protein [Campylobacterota bacterium]